MHRGKTIFAWLMIAVLIAGNASFAAASAQAETEDMITAAYLFASLVNQPNDPNWHIAETNPAGMRLTATSFQMINMSEEPDVNGEYITINFYAPESRYYDVNMAYWKNAAGGIVDVAIDGNTVLENLDFYSPTDTRSTPSTVQLAAGLKLSKGMHTLTFTAKETVMLPSNSKYYLYLYLQQLELIGKERFLELDSVEISAPKTNIAIGESLPLTITAKLNDGTPVNVSESVYVESSDPSVLVVSRDEQGEFFAMGIAEGKAAVQAEATYEGVMRSGELALFVGEPKLAEIDVSLYRTDLFVGDLRSIKIRGVLNNGEPADLSGATIAAESSDESVVRSGDGRQVEAVGPGSAVLTVTVTLGDVTLSDSVEVTVQEVTSSKTRSTLYTEEKVSAARSNIASYEWARNAMEGATAEADQYVALGYEALWNLVTPQTLPRSYAVNQELGSPITGKEIYKFGNYPWLADPLNQPWKLIDPSSGYVFPTNDFGAYYESGLDENGIFRPELADRSLLVNTLYPEKGPDWGVDDGFGWVDENGNRWTFIAYYNHWKIWHGGEITNALRSVRDAYVYTGDPKYARAGIVLLDRIADVYPEMDIAAYDSTVFLNSHGGTGEGKIIGSIWETGLARYFISAYDAFFPAMDDPEVISFLSAKAKDYDLGVLKTSAVGIRRNIEDGIIRQIYPAVKNAQIRGNNGMHQATLAMAAVVFDTLPETKEWLDFNFQTGSLLSGPWRLTGGNISALLVNDVDRDGAGNEASPSYNIGWLSALEEMANILEGYDLVPAADLYEHVKFRKMYSYTYPLTLSDRYIPLIGDTGNAGGPASILNQAQLVKAFETFGDPVYAQAAYFANGNRIDGIHSSIFTRNPEQVAEDIAAVIEEYGPFHLRSTNMTGYGFAALRDGVNERRFSGIGYNFSQLAVVEATAGYQLYTNSGTIQFDAEDAGHSLAFTFEVPRTDRYEIHLKPFRAPSYGIYEIAIDGSVVKQLDFYGTSGANAVLEVIADMELAEGEHTIRFTGVGKRDEATNYKMGVIQLQLYDEEAKRIRLDPNNKNTLRDVWMYYGRNTGHGHKDTLNIGMHAFGLNLLPELGYPEFADNNPRRYEWENHTISHNTVLVDRSKQQNQTAGQPIRFHDGEAVKVIEVEAPQVYPQTDLYRRTTAMIRVDEENSYAVDFFRVFGGNDHHFSFHAADAIVTTEGLNLVEQPTGTYAGEDVEYGVRPENDSVPGSGYMGPGFHYLKNVQRDASPGASFSVDWNIKDTWDIYGEGNGALTDVHLRLTMLGEFDEIALADGVPPRNKPGNPESMRYLIAHRSGENLKSTFTSVIEPYKGERLISAIEEAEVTVNGKRAPEDEVRAVKVVLANGRTDYIVSSIREDVLYTIDGIFEFQGGFGVHAVKDGRQVIGFVSGARVLTGTVEDFTKDLSVENEIIVRFDAAADDAAQLIGNYIYIENDGVRNASYLIQGATRLEDGSVRLDIGDVTLVRSYADANDFSRGFVYDIAEGRAFRIPLAAEFLFVPSLASLQELLERFIAEGDVSGPLASQLANFARQAAHHAEQGRNTQAAHHLQKFLDALHMEPLRRYVTPEAKALLTEEAEAVLEQLPSD